MVHLNESVPENELVFGSEFWIIRDRMDLSTHEEHECPENVQSNHIIEGLLS